MLDPGLQQYFRSLIEGGMSPTQALAVYEESLMGDSLGKLQFNREIKVRPYHSLVQKNNLFNIYYFVKRFLFACSEVEETSPYHTKSHPFLARYYANWT